jgi:DNA polymerase-1
VTTLLIDADGVAFQAAAAVQRGIRWSDDIYTTHADLNEAKDVYGRAIATIADAAGVPDANVILAYSCPTRHYFRHDLLPTYKGNRKDAPPLVLRDLKEWSKGEWDSRTKPGLEADDVLGILATHGRLIPGEKIIVSADKDLQQIPGLHMNARAPHEGVFRVQHEYAERFLWQQVLEGDSTDNYSGCPGIGAVKAAKLLECPRSLWTTRVQEAYEKAGRTAEDMDVQINVARILTADTYNFKQGTPILWSTPSPTLSQNAAPATETSPSTPKSRKRSRT